MNKFVDTILEGLDAFRSKSYVPPPEASIEAAGQTKMFMEEPPPLPSDGNMVKNTPDAQKDGIMESSVPMIPMGNEANNYGSYYGIPSSGIIGDTYQWGGIPKSGSFNDTQVTKGY